MNLNISQLCIAFLKEVGDPSKYKLVSSANCPILYLNLSCCCWVVVLFLLCVFFVFYFLFFYFFGGMVVCLWGF